MSQLIPVEIPKKVQDKIDYLCQTIDAVEWSGVLFYSVKGSIKNFNTVKLKVEDIYPMDKGTAGSTGYELGEDFIGYRMDNPETLAWKIGMIHSHHNMDAYFSSTDNSELNDNTEFHNYYLSIVVNNKGKQVGKVAFRGTIEGFTCKDEQGEDWNLSLTKDRQVMFEFDCKIDSVQRKIDVPKEFTERIKEISKSKVLNTAKFNSQAKRFNLPRNTKPWYKDKNDPFTKKGGRQLSPMELEMEKEMELEDEQGWNESFGLTEMYTAPEEMSTEELAEDFARYCLRLGANQVENDSIEQALEDSEIVENKQEYLNSMLNMYPALFEKYWDSFGEISTQVFFETTQEVINQLEVYQGGFEMGDRLCGGLELLIKNMKTNG